MKIIKILTLTLIVVLNFEAAWASEAKRSVRNSSTSAPKSRREKIDELREAIKPTEDDHHRAYVLSRIEFTREVSKQVSTPGVSGAQALEMGAQRARQVYSEEISKVEERNRQLLEMSIHQEK